jgi:NAD dependent epimerase/dehydratase family
VLTRSAEAAASRGRLCHGPRGRLVFDLRRYEATDSGRLRGGEQVIGSPRAQFVRDREAAVEAAQIAHAARAVIWPGAPEPLVELVRKRKLPVVGSGAGIWSWIHVDDAAAATVAALERGTPGIYNIVDDDPAPLPEWLPHLAEAVGARPPRHVPVWLGRLAAGEVGVSMMTRIRGSSNAKAKQELGWEPSWASWRKGFRHGLMDDGPAARSRSQERPAA